MDNLPFGDFNTGDFGVKGVSMEDWEIAYRNSLGKGIYDKMISLTWNTEIDKNPSMTSPLAIRALSLVGRYLHDCSPFLPYDLKHFGEYAENQDGLDIFDFLEGSVIDAAYYYIGECNVAGRIIEFNDEI